MHAEVMTDLQMRAADQDREQVVSQLGEHLSTGRLTMPEFDERVSAAYEAKTYGALEALLSDLPREDAALARPAATAVASRPMPSNDAGAWTPWLVATVITVGIWLMTSIGNGEADYFWPMWVFGPWGLILGAATLTGRANRRPIRG